MTDDLGLGSAFLAHPGNIKPEASCFMMKMLIVEMCCVQCWQGLSSYKKCVPFIK